MQISKVKVTKFLARVIILGVVLTFISTVYKFEYHIPPSLELCVMLIFKKPLKQTSYGLPFFWLSSVEGVYKYGCGPVVSHFSEYSLLWQGLLGDVLFYASCCSLLLYCRNRLKNMKFFSILTSKEPKQVH